MMSRRTHGVETSRELSPASARGDDAQGLRHILYLLMLFRDSRWQIILFALAAATVIFVVTEFCLIHYYQATAIIRPVSQADQGNLVSGMLSGVTSTLGALTGLSGDEEKDAEKYISIVNSYAFTMDLLKRTNLAPRLMSRSLGYSLLGLPVSDYRLYKKMAALFDADFSLKTGNITMTFLDPDPVIAKKVLADYVNLLRARLRQHEIESSSAAITAMQKAAVTTSDPLLQATLYDAVTKQIQRRGMAEVQADFSFEVIDPAVVSDKIYEPKVALNSVLALVLGAVVAMLFISLKDHVSSVLGQIDSLEPPSARLADEDEAASRRARR
jgi:LPS O-antigen subunit length determinant protein (WzzB/FepE family)